MLARWRARRRRWNTECSPSLSPSTMIVFFMMEGISKVVFALTIRPFPNWGWVLASGLVGILLALILWANLPATAVWLIGLLLGCNLVSVGAAIAYLAWQVRKS
jgi:uncharacterized membrane protein HdeD (DUF308 family)